jgi:hypothetical protein
MAHGVNFSRPLKLQQALHGYSEGHRLLGSSLELVGRDAKTMLMMSDASGPAAVIGDEGYLTGYPLPENGYYAFARTWPAPEMSRPGCVWTHTILVEFSDIPALQSASWLLGLFRRPSGKDRGYDETLILASEGSTDTPPPPDPDAAGRILWAIYGNPSKPIVSSILDQGKRDELVLAIWDQQWPRLKRVFRFCTLSFADRSAIANVFDLQFLPGTGRVSRALFRTALDADRSEVEFSDWLEDAVSDLRDGPAGDLRRFLRTAGSDVSGREAFVPLANLHALSRHFASAPNSVERAISLLEETIPKSQGHAARALITRAAGAAPDNLSPLGLTFVVKNFDLIEESEAAAIAEKVGRALWTSDPGRVVELLFDDSIRRQIAEKALASMPLSALVEGCVAVSKHWEALFDARPDLGTESSFWSLPEVWSAASLRRAAEHRELAPAMIAAMVRSERPSIREACNAFGHENVLRQVVRFLDSGKGLPPTAAKAWLSETCADPDAVARCLCEESIGRTSTLEALSRVMSPDFVTNDFGDDPWLIALGRTEGSDPQNLYLLSFLLARAFGRRTRNCAGLVRIAFDNIYAAAERAALPDDAWRLLDDRLYQSFFWPNWDRCARIRRTIADLFVNRWLDQGSFLRITSKDEIFKHLVDIAANSANGQKYLNSVQALPLQEGEYIERIRMIKSAIW